MLKEFLNFLKFQIRDDIRKTLQNILHHSVWTANHSSSELFSSGRRPTLSKKLKILVHLEKHSKVQISRLSFRNFKKGSQIVTVGPFFQSIAAA